MRVLIIDDDPLSRDGMQALLARMDPGVEVSSASVMAVPFDGMEGADLVLLDMGLPGASHEEALRWISLASRWQRVAVVSAEHDRELMDRALEAGAVGVVPKTTDQMRVIDALRRVLAPGAGREPRP